MVPYFLSKERQEDLFEILESWLGTPSNHRGGAVKGLGADCVSFVHESLKESGGIDGVKVNFPADADYPRDRALHSKEEVLLEILRSIPEVREYNKRTKPINGDICCYQFGLSTSHFALYYGGRIYHSLTRTEVHRTRFDEAKYLNRLTAIFRLMEKL